MSEATVPTDVPAIERYRLHELDHPDGPLAVGVWTPVGESQGTVMAVHGITGNHRALAYLADELPDHRILAPDLRGRGGSNFMSGPYGMRAHADDLAFVADQFGESKVIPVGHSMGAFVCVVFADRHPDRLERLVLVDGGLPLATSGPPEGAEADEIAERVTAPIAARLKREYESPEASLDFWRAHPGFAKSYNPVVEWFALWDLKREAPWRSRVSETAMAADSRDLLDGEDGMAALKRLRHPVTLLLAPRGLLDDAPLFKSDVVEFWLAHFAGIDVDTVEDTNHYSIIMDRPGAARVADAVERDMIPPPVDEQGS